MKRIVFLLLMILATFFVTACESIVKVREDSLIALKNKQVIYNKHNYPVTIENINSKAEPELFTYTKPPQRVVAVWQNSIENLLELGVGDRIIAGIGVPDKKYFRKRNQEQYSKIPYTSLENLDLETIVMMDPDLIVGWRSTFTPKVLRSTDFWHNRGVGTYIALYGAAGKNAKRTIETEYKDILNLGKIFDREERAKTIVKEMQDEIKFVTDRTQGRNFKPRGLIIEVMGKEIRAYGKKSLPGNILETLNGELLASDSVSVSYEQIVDMDPDVIFMIMMESRYATQDIELKRITENKVLRNLKCVKEKRVYGIPLYAVYSSGVRTLDGVQIMARGLYPELYTEAQNAKVF